jgi:hypothetical protein
MHKFRSQQVEGFGLSSPKSVLDLEIPALDITQLAKPCLQGLDQYGIRTVDR